jgi:NAD(P)-dependent dehydrogenase (short-subunit alcohol dehydrogenase family)
VKNQVAVVTGASRGIGQAISDALLDKGFEVHSWSRSDGVDVTDESQVTRAAAKLDRLDVLVNNAGWLETCHIADMTSDVWQRTLSVNLTGAFLCSRAAFRLMRPGSSIVMVSSLSGVAGAERFAGMAAYVAAKSGLAGLTEALAVEGKPLGIRVNAVSPGSVDTDMLKLAPVPSGPTLKPKDVAGIVAWLAGPESAPLTGANLRLNS